MMMIIGGEGIHPDDYSHRQLWKRNSFPSMGLSCESSQVSCADMPYIGGRNLCKFKGIFCTQSTCECTVSICVFFGCELPFGSPLKWERREV